jgi:hypothetical protein
MTPNTATLLTIGELAERTGLSVRTIRFYSDSGVVPPAGRTDAGYRLYGPDAPATDWSAAAALAERFAAGTDARAERYWQLLALINGWPPVPTTVPAWEWLIAALRAG